MPNLYAVNPATGDPEAVENVHVIVKYKNGLELSKIDFVTTDESPLDIVIPQNVFYATGVVADLTSNPPDYTVTYTSGSYSSGSHGKGYRGFGFTVTRSTVRHYPSSRIDDGGLASVSVKETVMDRPLNTEPLHIKTETPLRANTHVQVYMLHG